jgi:hypothetical protein
MHPMFMETSDAIGLAFRCGNQINPLDFALGFVESYKANSGQLRTRWTHRHKSKCLANGIKHGTSDGWIAGDGKLGVLDIRCRRRAIDHEDIVCRSGPESFFVAIL